MMAIFAPDILREVMKSITIRDVKKVFRAVLIIALIVYYLADEELLAEVDRCVCVAPPSVCRCCR